MGIHKLIDDAIASGVTSDKIVLGGCVCFSGWPALSGADGALRAQLKRGKYATTPALVCHGTADGVVLPECGEAVKDLLEEADVPVVYKTYPMAHSTHPQ